MSYNYDPELPGMLELLPNTSLGISEPATARAGFLEMVALFNAEISWDYCLGDQFQRGTDHVPCHAAPARAEDLSGLPPAYVSTMEFDPLRDDGVEYALKLMRAGVANELHSFPGTFHGSALFSTTQISKRESSEIFAVLRRALHIST